MNVSTKFLEKVFSDEVDSSWTYSNEKEVISLLDHIISLYLESHFEKLLNIMYRMDVDEFSFSKALQESKPSLAVAKLVFEREKKRQFIREKYKNKDMT